MPSRILHLIDPTTPADALNMLALLIAHGEGSPALTHRVVAMGHRSTRMVADQAGLGGGEVGRGIAWVPSMGWADPVGWRAVRKLIADFKPTHVHAWGIHGVAATALSRFGGRRIATCADVPSRGHLRILRLAACRKTRAKSPWTWVATSSSIREALVSGGLPAAMIVRISPGIPSEKEEKTVLAAGEVKKTLGIDPSNADIGPMILLGGEGAAARHDYGLWAVAILQQIFPNTRAIVREDPRGASDSGLSRFIGALPEDGMLVIAPLEMSWRELLGIADLLLVTPDRAMPNGTILAAMAVGVPVVGTPVECVTELIEHGRNGLVASAVKPRAIAACLEEFMNRSTLRQPLTDCARADVAAHYGVPAMREAFEGIYRKGPE